MQKRGTTVLFLTVIIENNIHYYCKPGNIGSFKLSGNEKNGRGLILADLLWCVNRPYYMYTNRNTSFGRDKHWCFLANRQYKTGTNISRFTVKYHHYHPHNINVIIIISRLLSVIQHVYTF